MNIALVALEATVQIKGAKGEREVPIGEFHLLPGKTPHRENVLEPGDLVTSVTLPAAKAGSKQTYLKLRDRASYEFALASTAIVAEVHDGKVGYIRVALGGVGTKPWRSHEAEKALMGKASDAKNFRAAAEAALHEAKPHSENGFKVELTKRCIVHALHSRNPAGISRRDYVHIFYDGTSFEHATQDYGQAATRRWSVEGHGRGDVQLRLQPCRVCCTRCLYVRRSQVGRLRRSMQASPRRCRE